MKILLITLTMLLAALQDSKPWRIVCEGGGKTWSAREDGSDRREETSSGTPRGALSPDGKRRVTNVRGGESQPDIWVTDADGKNAKRLTMDLWFDGPPSWASDGQRIVWQTQRGNEWQVWIMDADGRNDKALTSHPGGAHDPHVSPSGDRIAYLEIHPERSKLPASTLWTMDLAGRDAKTLIEKTQMLGHAWSPKGDRIACSLVQEIRILEVPSGKTVKSFKLEDVHKDLYAHAAYGMIWRPDGGAIACTIPF